MSENLNELKRLFDEQVAVIAQKFVNKAAKRFQVTDEDALRRKNPALAEKVRSKGEDFAASALLAMLLDGNAIPTARSRLEEAKSFFEDLYKVDAVSIRRYLLDD